MWRLNHNIQPLDTGRQWYGRFNIFIFLLLYLLFFTVKTLTYFTISISFPYVINK